MTAATSRWFATDRGVCWQRGRLNKKGNFFFALFLRFRKGRMNNTPVRALFVGTGKERETSDTRGSNKWNFFHRQLTARWFNLLERCSLINLERCFAFRSVPLTVYCPCPRCDGIGAHSLSVAGEEGAVWCCLRFGRASLIYFIFKHLK